MNNINFKSSYIDKISISRKDNTSKYHQYVANLVKLDKADLNILEEINKTWDKNDFGRMFVDWAKTEHKSNNKLYAVTTQKNNFDNLHADNIIGLINFSIQKRNCEIHYLETKNANNTAEKEYANVGTSLINFLKNKTKQITLFAITEELIEIFYKQLGFINRYTDKKDNKYYGELIWIKNPTITDKIQTFLQKQYKLAIDKFKLH